MVDHPILTGLINALRVLIIPAAGTWRIGVNSLKGAFDEESRAQNRKRTKNVIMYMIFAECSVSLIDLAIKYFS